MDNPSDSTSSANDLPLVQDVIPAFSPDHRYYLEEVQQHLSRDGFYAYLMIDDQQRWIVAADDEAGRVDVRLEGRQYTVEVCGSSPGLFIEENSDWRRQALERLARRAVPNVARGLLAPNQSAVWNEDDRGVAVCITHAMPIEHADRIPLLVRGCLTELGPLLSFVESELRS